MKQERRRAFLWLILGCGLLAAVPARAHHAPATARAARAQAPAAKAPARVAGVSGQGKMRFRVLYTSAHLPEQARTSLQPAHGGFAVDRRPGKGETYFALAGAGILQISSDLKTVRILETPGEMKGVNLHNTTIWYSPQGAPYLVFPANDAGRVFTVTLDGKLLHTLGTPTGAETDQPEVADYFAGKGHFTPTDVEYLDGLYYVTTGYSPLDFVLTARVFFGNAFRAAWHDLAFGGKGDGPAQFRTAHGVTIPPGRRRLDISDRPKSEIKRFTRYGHYLSTLKMPMGSLPCDIDYLDDYAVVASLDGPDRGKGAPIYVLENDRLISTIMPKEDLGLENFRHIHNAVLHKVGNRFYIIAQAWNPGDFAVLEQVSE